MPASTLSGPQDLDTLGPRPQSVNPLASQKQSSAAGSLFPGTCCFRLSTDRLVSSHTKTSSSRHTNGAARARPNFTSKSKHLRREPVAHRGGHTEYRDKVLALIGRFSRIRIRRNCYLVGEMAHLEVQPQRAQHPLLDRGPRFLSKLWWLPSLTVSTLVPLWHVARILCRQSALDPTE